VGVEWDSTAPRVYAACVKKGKERGVPLTPFATENQAKAHGANLKKMCNVERWISEWKYKKRWKKKLFEKKCV